MKELNIDKGNNGISLSHLNDIKQCHIITLSYSELTSVSLNKTEVKRVINWLERWVEFKEVQASLCEVQEK